MAGFSLLELAIVLFILAILLSGLLVPLAVRQEQSNRNDTELMLEQARDAIYGYTFSNGRLPCPDCADGSGPCSAVAAGDVNDGEEDRDGTPGNNCITEHGRLPWVDLSIGQLDAWGNAYSYSVDNRFADDVDGTPPCETGPPTPNVSFSLCSTGDITVHNDAPTDSTNIIAENIPAIIVSHGANFSENDPSSYETENLYSNNDTDYVQRDFSQTEDQEFDDMLIWISPHNLRLKMVEAGLLP